jgi:hypothetical protein
VKTPPLAKPWLAWEVGISRNRANDVNANEKAKYQASQEGAWLRANQAVRGP